MVLKTISILSYDQTLIIMDKNRSKNYKSKTFIFCTKHETYC